MSVEDVSGGMSLSAEDIEEYRRIIKEETGVEMTPEEAFTSSYEMVALVRMLVSPFPEDPEIDREKKDS